MNLATWAEALRSGVVVITFILAAVAGLLTFRTGRFDLGLWLLMAFGLLLAYATSNLLNDLTDYVKGVDCDNDFRSQYGPHPVEPGLLSKGQVLAYA